MACCHSASEGLMGGRTAGSQAQRLDSREMRLDLADGGWPAELLPERVELPGPRAARFACSGRSRSERQPGKHRQKLVAMLAAELFQGISPPAIVLIEVDAERGGQGNGDGQGLLEPAEAILQ